MTRRILLVAALSLARALPAAETRWNPVSPDSSPDPTVWRASDGTWYSTSTSLKLLTSVDGV